MPLPQNAKKSFQGSIVLGKGFVLTIEEAERLLAKDPRNKDVLFPYLNGDDLNNDPEQKPSRWVINFFDWTEEKARTYPDCFEIIEQLVKPERMLQKDKGGQEKWWQFLRPRSELYQTISKLDQVMVSCRVSKYVNHTFLPTNYVFDVGTNVIARNSYYHFAILQSSFHDFWAWKHASTLESRIRYLNVDCIDSFPIIETQDETLFNSLYYIGKQFYSHRAFVMQEMGIGLTKVYNLFHRESLSQDEVNNVIKSDKRSSIDLFDAIIELRNLQIKLDNNILNLYEWNDIKLEHGFYENESLPENDRVRFTLNHKTKKEILKRLHNLNVSIFNQENQENKITSKRKNASRNQIKNSSNQDLFS